MAKERFPAAAWCRNLVEAGAVSAGERVLVVVDEPLAEEGSELAAAIREAGADPQLELWAGERPLAEPPPAIQAAAEEADLYINEASSRGSRSAG